ncbi:MAG: ABC transporter permease [Gemmatimonadaceae bacterium]
MHELRAAIRSLRKQSGFTALALFTLALGIGATTAAFTVLDTVLLRPLPYRDSGRLVLLQERSRKGTADAPSFPNFADWRAQARAFSGMAAVAGAEPATLKVGAEAIRVTVKGVSRGFFAVLGVTPAVGREFTDDENRAGGRDAAMVSYDFWQSQMGGRLPLGSIEGTPIVGVLPQGFHFLDDADIYTPHERFPGTCRTCRNYVVVGRLAANATLSSARAEMTALSHALLATYGTETSAADVDVMPLREFLTGDYRMMLTLVFAASALVLLIACTNLVSALLARGLRRGREMAVRAALGASRVRLMRQLLVESGLLAIAGAGLGAALAVVLTRVVRIVGAGLLPRLDELHVDAPILAFTAALSVLTAVIIGVYPALRLAGGNPGQLLHGARGSGGTVRGRVWRALVAFEIATAFVLAVGSTLMIRTLHNILTEDTGFQAHGLVTAALVPGDTVDLARFGQLRADLAALPGVQGVAFANRVPLRWGSASGPVRRPNDPLDRDWPAMAGFRLVSSEYFSVLRQPVQRGRDFTPADKSGAPLVAIITPGIAAKLWPGEDPLGKLIATNYLMKRNAPKGSEDNWLTVVGVVAEASSWTMTRGTQNEIYVPLAQFPGRAEGQLAAFVRTSGNPVAMIPSIRTRLHALAPEMPARLGTIDERIATTAAGRTFAMVALTAFGAVALLLAGVGIYGTMSYTFGTRTNEIGVRMALGATPGLVRSEVLLDAVVMAATGIAVGVAGALFATRFLQSTLYGVSHVDPLAYIAGAAALMATALAGAYLPAHRSSRVDPMLAMRAE